MKKPVQYFMHLYRQRCKRYTFIYICNGMQCTVIDTIIFGLCTGKEVAVDSVTMPTYGQMPLLYICMQI
jgi:hypothetical protein